MGRPLLLAAVLGALIYAAFSVAAPANASTTICKVEAPGCVTSVGGCLIDLHNGFVETFDNGDSFTVIGADGKPSTWTCVNGSWVVSLTAGQSPGIRGFVLGLGEVYLGPPPALPPCPPDTIEPCF